MGHPLVTVARDAMAAHLERHPFTPPDLEAPWREARPVFVSLHTPDGALRGCIGHLVQTCATLSEEVATTAVLAATQDPRFPRVEPGELADLDVEISILEAPQPIDDPSQLDPQRFGVVVRAGHRRGVLLPDLEGVDTVADQLSIARRKAGIGPMEPIEIERFEVTKIR